MGVTVSVYLGLCWDLEPTLSPPRRDGAHGQSRGQVAAGREECHPGWWLDKEMSGGHICPYDITGNARYNSCVGTAQRLILGADIRRY